MGRRPREQSELAEVMRRLYALPWRDRLAAYEALRDHLGAEAGAAAVGESKADLQIRRRAEALEVMARVAEHLGLGEGEAPSTAQFRRAVKELGASEPGFTGWSVSRVQRAFGFWHNAQAALIGGWVPETPAQRSLRRKTAGRARAHEDYIDGIRLWLGSKPASRSAVDYDEFIHAYNDPLPEGKAPLVTSDGLRAVMLVGWADILAITEGRKTLAAARRDAETQLRARAGSKGLVGQQGVALLLGIGAPDVTNRARKPGFPVVVATIGRTKAWLLADIEAYRDGRPVPKRRPGELQGELLDSGQVGQLLDIHGAHLRTLIHREKWNLVPQPAGQVGQVHYWVKQDVEKWLSTRERRARRPVKRARNR